MTAFAHDVICWIGIHHRPFVIAKRSSWYCFILSYNPLLAQYPIFYIFIFHTNPILFCLLSPFRCFGTVQNRYNVYFDHVYRAFVYRKKVFPVGLYIDMFLSSCYALCIEREHTKYGQLHWASTHICTCPSRWHTYGCFQHGAIDANTFQKIKHTSMFVYHMNDTMKQAMYLCFSVLRLIVVVVGLFVLLTHII